MMKKHRIKHITGEYSVCRLPASADIPQWVGDADGFCSITRTDEELSVVCRAELIPEGTPLEPSWCCLKVLGPLDFGDVGIMSSLSGLLAGEGISVFIISTYDTDYILLKTPQLMTAMEAFRRAGHEIVE